MENNGSQSKERVEEEYQDGSIYYGEKENGLRHGYGRFSYNDGGIYEGEWKYGTMDGYGKLYYPSGKLAYEGEWKQNTFNGNGKVFNESPSSRTVSYDYKNFDLLDDDWERFEGKFVDDYKHGMGVLYLVNGERYMGSFKEDMISGEGQFYTLDNNIINGNWVENKL